MGVEYGLALTYIALVGLRSSEGCQSSRLIVELSEMNKLNEYYDSKLTMLMHFRYLSESPKRYVNLINEVLQILPKDYDLLGIVLLVWSSLFVLSFAILAFVSPSHFRTQRAQIFVLLTILVAVLGISLILSGRAKKEKTTMIFNAT